VQVNLVEPATLYGDRMNQVDMRIGKILRFGPQRRAGVNFEIYNLLNSDAVLDESQSYSTLRVPAVVIGARLFKFSVQLDF